MNIAEHIHVWQTIHIFVLTIILDIAREPLTSGKHFSLFSYFADISK